MKIILTGGGTGGPVFPLIAVAQKLKKLHPDVEFLFMGTKAGPEREIVGDAGIRFESISSGKFRRYFSLKNVTDFFSFIAGFFQSRKIIREFRPDLIFTAGGYVGVPLAYAAKMAKIKILVHQQDAMIGMANKLVAPFAYFITTAFEQTAKEFFSGSGFEKNQKIKTEWVGNPVREEFFEKTPSNRNVFHLHSELPVLFITGGGTGAEQINQVVEQALPELVKSHQVIHVTGRGKNLIKFSDPNYHVYEFIGKHFVDAMKIADIVISRAGLSTIAELSALGKVSIIVPMPDSHQEKNAEILKDAHAAITLNKEEFNPETLVRVVVSVKFNQKRIDLLKENMFNLMPHDSAERIAKIIVQILHNE